MNHEQYQQLASQFIDRELQSDAEQQLFLHLGTCTECREFLKASWKLQTDIYATMPKDAPQLEAVKAKELRQTSLPLPRRAANLVAQTWRKRIQMPVAATLALLTLAGGIVLSALWFPPKEKIVETKSEVVYVPRLPAIQVIGFYQPKDQLNK